MLSPVTLLILWCFIRLLLINCLCIICVFLMSLWIYLSLYWDWSTPPSILCRAGLVAIQSFTLFYHGFKKKIHLLIILAWAGSINLSEHAIHFHVLLALKVSTWRRGERIVEAITESTKLDSRGSKRLNWLPRSSHGTDRNKGQTERRLEIKKSIKQMKKHSGESLQ